MSTVHVVLPEGVHDPARPSGGNTYDRRVCAGLGAAGWRVRAHSIPGSWPLPGTAAREALAVVLAGIPDGSVVLVDGLLACSAPGALVRAADRVRLVVLVHMPLGDGPAGHEIVGARERERDVLAAATAIITTSGWTRERLLDEYPLDARRVRVAEPGADRADVAPGTPAGGQLLCVAAVAPHKGHDMLLAALADNAGLPWCCTCVGPLDRDPRFVARLRRAAQGRGIVDRLRFAGTRSGAELEQAYAAADALVLASRVESYGMVVTEALAHGLPVIATAVGGLPEALGRTADGRLPGLLVPPGDQHALTVALRRWLQDAHLRHQLREAALDRRESLSGWAVTAAAVAGVLSGGAP